MRVPSVERDHRQAGVVAVGAGVLAEGGEVDKAVGGPVEVGVVEDQARPRRGRLPALGGGQLAEEVDQRQQGGAAAPAEPLAQGLFGLEIGGEEQRRLEAPASGPGRDLAAVGEYRRPFGVLLGRAECGGETGIRQFGAV